MARRATLFEKLREKARSEGDALLTVAGPYEFQRIRAINHPKGHYEKLARAYTLLNYDLGMLCAAEADSLKSLQVSFPSTWVAVADRPVARIIHLQDTPIGFLLLPGPEKTLNWETLQDAVAEQARELKGKVDLLLGISPWGISREQEFLDEHPGLFDIFLGGGPGTGIDHRFAGNHSTLWIRPFRKGKTVSRISMPDRTTLHQQSGFDLNAEIEVETIVLNQDIPDDPAIVSIF